MKTYFLQKRSYRILLGTILIALCLLLPANNINAQPTKPGMPILSLTGSISGYDGSSLDSWYPDGRIWNASSVDADNLREVLVPVFITNRWVDYTENPKYKTTPITSFQFSLQYDSAQFRAVGYQLAHPNTNTNTTDPRFLDNNAKYYEPLAKNFKISWEDNVDTTYKLIFGDIQLIDRNRGRRIRITAISNFGMPNTDKYSESDIRVLLYIKFKVMPIMNQGSTQGNEQPLIICDDTIKYNDLNVVETAPFVNMRPYDTKVADDYPDPVASNRPGLGGLDTNMQSSAEKKIEPEFTGVIYSYITTTLPKFNFLLERTIGSNPAISMLTNDYWIMVDPLTCDSGWTSNNWSPYDQLMGTRDITVQNSTSQTRMLDVNIATNEPWLFVKSTNFNNIGFWFRDTRKENVPQIILDEDIIGNLQLQDIEGSWDVTKVGQEPMALRIKADESYIEQLDKDYEKTGVYVGYITFDSPNAEYSPVKLRVTFIRYRNPSDDIKSSRYNENPGIYLTIRNSDVNYPTGDTCKLVFGTGFKATSFIDTLFGETPYLTPLTDFGARWYPMGSDGKVITKYLDALGNSHDVTYGIQDIAGWLENPRTLSRDIRSNTDTNTSILYYCRFNAGVVNNYPIAIEWDTGDFPDGAQLFIRDTLNGSLFPAVNMRNATVLNKTSRGERQSYWISDPRVTSFIIEYTLPKIVNYVDIKGSPIIKPNWNFLSIPVRPTNTYYKSFYPNAMNKPWYYSANGYQFDDYVRPGIGYFIRYSDIVDQQFVGIAMNRITIENYYDGIADEDIFRDTVAVYKNMWQTVGALTYPINVSDIDFSSQGLTTPDKDYSIGIGFWGYKTDKGYYSASELTPGLGYWVKTNANGYLRLVNPNTSKISENNSIIVNKNTYLNACTKLTINDNAQRETQLYLTNDSKVDLNKFELPPLPPNELFDARFVTNTYLQNSNSSIIAIQSPVYPVAISINSADAKYTFIDPVNNKVFGTINKNTSGSVLIKSTASDNVLVLRESTENASNIDLSVNATPNVVSEKTVIIYSIPTSNFVTIKLYDALGNEVSTIVNEYTNAGSYTANLDASLLSSGRYNCRLISGSLSVVCPITVIK